MKLTPEQQVEELAALGLTWKRPGRFWRYRDALVIIRGRNFNTRQEYRREVRQKNLPRGLPLHPNKVYWDDGWTDWDDYLGIPKVTYEDAVVLVRRDGISSGAAYREAYQEGNLPRGFPVNPETAFKDRWNGWGAFLGCEVSFNEKSERIRQGLKRTQDSGIHVGRPRVEFNADDAAILKKRLSWKELSCEMGVSVSTLRRTLGQMENKVVA